MQLRSSISHIWCLFWMFLLAGPMLCVQAVAFLFRCAIIAWKAGDKGATAFWGQK